MQAPLAHKALLLCTLLMGCAAGAFSYSGDSLTLNVTLLPGSTVAIEGYTNVNTFTCAYCGDTPVVENAIETAEDMGEWLLDPQNARIALEVNSFDCGLKQMNEDFRELLNAPSHPTLQISLSAVEYLEEDLYSLTANLKVAGTSRQVCLPLRITSESTGILSARGALSVHLTDFGLEPPTRLMGMVKVKDKIKVIFDLQLKVTPLP
ncbi:YceI family protein [Roseivirga sp. BDSF3-8]|uniref:YceI family protein n=1 Tax=Roseivirga sp. BDSF3-8 TaxID=3241598 RepID=UPI003531D689